MSSHRLWGNAATYALANAASSAIPFLLLPVLTRVLSPHEYGMVTVFTTLTLVFGAVTGLSVHGAVNVRYFDRAIDHPRYIGSALAILCASTLASLVLALLAAPWVSSWLGLSPAWLVLAVGASAAQFVLQIRLLMWQVRGQAVRYGTFQVLHTALNLGLSLLLVLHEGFGWEGRAAGVVIATFTFAGIGIATLHRSSAVTWRPERHYMRDALRFGLPLIPHVVGSLCIAASDRLMIARLLDLHEAGVYAAGMQMGLVVAVMADAAVKAFTPWLYENLSRGDALLKRRIVRATYLFFAAMLVAAAAFGAAAPWLMLAVGEQFRAGQEVVAYIALGAAFGGMYLVMVNYVFYAGRTGWLSMASLSAGSVNLLLAYVLIRHNGAAGAAQAYALSQLLLFVLVWAIAARSCPMPWRSALRNPIPHPAGA